MSKFESSFICLARGYNIQRVLSCEAKESVGFGCRNSRCCCCFSAGWIILHPVLTERRKHAAEGWREASCSQAVPPAVTAVTRFFFTLLKTFLPSLHPDNEQYTFYSMCTCAQVLHVACTVCSCCTLLSCSQGALDYPDFRASSKNIAVGLNRVYCRKHKQLWLQYIDTGATYTEPVLHCIPGHFFSTFFSWIYETSQRSHNIWQT